MKILVLTNCLLVIKSNIVLKSSSESTHGYSSKNFNTLLSIWSLASRVVKGLELSSGQSLSVDNE